MRPSFLAMGLALAAAAPCPNIPVPFSPHMDCGANVRQCGVLAVDTGLGFFGGLGGAGCPGSDKRTGCTDGIHPPYSLPSARVHGLWPQTAPYGTSECVPSSDYGTACQNQAWVFAPEAFCKTESCQDGVPSCYSAKSLPPCYDMYQGPFSEGEVGQLQRRYMLWFVNHEWQKHGRCAGLPNPTSFFSQVCDLVGPIKDAVDSYRLEGLNNYTDVHTIACKLDASFSDVEVVAHDKSSFGTSGEILISACRSPRDGKWRLAPTSRFHEVCGGPNSSRTELVVF